MIDFYFFRFYFPSKDWAGLGRKHWMIAWHCKRPRSICF